MPDSEIRAVFFLQICFEIVCLLALSVVVLQTMRMQSITFLDATLLNERVTLFYSARDFNPLNVDILLFGDNNLTNVEKILGFSLMYRHLSKVLSALSINVAFVEPTQPYELILLLLFYVIHPSSSYI